MHDATVKCDAVAVLQPEDVETICNMVSMLTSLHMGYCPRLQVGALVFVGGSQ
jgi:hypothetical protein